MRNVLSRNFDGEISCIWNVSFYWNILHVYSSFRWITKCIDDFVLSEAAELRQLYAGITKDLPSRTNKQPARKKKGTTEKNKKPKMSSKRKTVGWGKRRQSVHPYPIEVKGMTNEKLESAVAIEMKKLEDQGLPLEDLDDEAERWNVIQTLRSIPAPIRTRIGVRYVDIHQAHTHRGMHMAYKLYVFFLRVLNTRRL